MTSVSRVSQSVSQSSVSGGREWDHRLDNLLDDLQETVVPPESRGANTSSYREYRVRTSSQRNNEPVSQTDEKWVEYGTGQPGGGGPGFGGCGHSHNIDSGFHAINDSSAYGGSRSTTTTEKTVNFSDDHFSKSFTGGSSDFINNSLDKSQSRHVEYLTPANATTVLKSGPSAPNNVLCASTPPKVERKEYFAKASYTTVIKGGPGEVSQVVDSRDSQTDRMLQDIIPRNALPESSYSPHQPGVSSNVSETRRTFTSESTRGTSSSGGGVPDLPVLYSSPPVKSSSYSREVNTNLNQSVTSSPKPAEPLKTPPVVRRILQQASSSSNYNSSSSKMQESPKRLDELMATFEDSSYTSTRHISGDGGGPHESHPYGPGTHHVERPMTQTRTVRIDESATTRRIIDDETDLHQRKSTSYQNPAYGGKDSGPSRNVSGPPVFYPSNQIFPKAEEDISPDKSKKPKKEPKKVKQGDDKGSGAVPVPVCLPVCCAAPCSIM